MAPRFSTARLTNIEDETPRREYASADDFENRGQLARDPAAFWDMVDRVRADGPDYQPTPGVDDAPRAEPLTDRRGITRAGQRALWDAICGPEAVARLAEQRERDARDRAAARVAQGLAPFTDTTEDAA